MEKDELIRVHVETAELRRRTIFFARPWRRWSSNSSRWDISNRMPLLLTDTTTLWGFIWKPAHGTNYLWLYHVSLEAEVMNAPVDAIPATTTVMTTCHARSRQERESAEDLQQSEQRLSLRLERLLHVFAIWCLYRIKQQLTVFSSCSSSTLRRIPRRVR